MNGQQPIRPLARFRTAESIVMGSGCLAQIANYMSELQLATRHVLIVTSQSPIKSGFLDTIRVRLASAGISSTVLTGVQPEPTINDVQHLFDQIRGDSYDVYVGLGGGSVLDVVKLLSVLRTNDQSITDMIGIDRIERAGIPTVLIPTTSGTGSEVTPNAILTLPEEELKVGVVSRYLLPRIAILDPELTISLPPSITAATGMDAFTHALESYISIKSNSLSDMFALEAIRSISGSIREAYENGSSLKARESMLVGSMYGGMALTAAGTAAVHALAYPLGGKFGITHGVANAMLLPHVMSFNRDSIENKLSEAACAMGLCGKETPPSQAADLALDCMYDWARLLGIPQDLKSFGVREEHVDGLSEAASKVTRLLNNNPKPMSVNDIRNVYLKLL